MRRSTATSAGDPSYGTRRADLAEQRPLRRPSAAARGCGGVAYVGVFGARQHPPTPLSAGLGLPAVGSATTPRASPRPSATRSATTSASSHDGTTRTSTRACATSYYCGHAMWAPIMGVGYYRPVAPVEQGRVRRTPTTPSRTTSPSSRLGRRTVTRRGRRRRSATAAAGLPTVRRTSPRPPTPTPSALGTCTGTLTLSATGLPPSPNLDIQLELLDSAGTVVATNNPASAFVDRDTATGLTASITAGVAAGSYYARVDGVGNGTGATGYTDYGSIGAYTLTVTGSATGRRPPAAPTNLAATTNAPGTSADGQPWATPVSDGGSPVMGYTASRSGAVPGVAESPRRSRRPGPGSTPGANYLFSVQATNAIGTGVAASQSVTMPNPTAPAVTPGTVRGCRPGCPDRRT